VRAGEPIPNQLDDLAEGRKHHFHEAAAQDVRHLKGQLCHGLAGGAAHTEIDVAAFWQFKEIGGKV
jgi:hypothetical protein